MAQGKEMYRTVMDDHFPERMIIQFGNQILVYRKRSWKIPDEKTGEWIEKGLRYGENPGQEAALYELINGHLALGGCEFIGPGKGLVSAISEKEMLQSGKHPGKINFTDADNALNILKYLMDRPAAAIMKHNNPSGVAYGNTLAEAYDRADLADRIAAFGGCLAVNRAMDKATAEMVSEHYLEVVVAPDYEESTVDILKRRGNLRIVRVPRMERLAEYREVRFVDFKSLMDGGIIVQQSSLNAIDSKKDFQKATATYKGKTYTVEREPTGRRIRRYDLWLGCGAGGILQFGALRERRPDSRNWNGGAGPRGGGGNCRFQSLHQICRCPLLREVRDSL